MSDLEQEHAKIAAELPQWADPEARAAIKQQIREHGKSQGFTEAELDAVDDARTVLIAYQAMKRGKELAADRAAQDAAQRAAEAKARAREAERLVEKAANSHRQRDAAEALKLMIPD